MKLIITGASGFVGRRLVPALRAKGHELLLLGRDPAALQAHYRDCDCANSDSIEASEMSGFDGCIHLAARNNDQPGSEAQFIEDNVTRLKNLLEKQQSAGVCCQIYLSSILADADNPSPYGKSKALAEEKLQQMSQAYEALELTILRPAFIHARPFRGKLKLLNHLPVFLGEGAFQAFSALRPALDYDRLEAAILSALEGTLPPDQQALPFTNRQMGNPIYHTARWLIDMAFVLAVLLVFGWLFPLLWLLIRLDSPGQALFRQERVGQGGKVFCCYKFRTMKKDTKAAATHEVGQSSVTRMGSFLRKSKIDELPQIWNIARREMSLVGPRPCLPVQAELIDWRQRLGVLDILPGITGYAQVQNIDMSQPEKLAHTDADYIARRTLILDIQIILQTFLGRGMRDYVKG